MRKIIQKNKIQIIIVLSVFIVFFIIGIFFRNYVYVLDESILIFIRQLLNINLTTILRCITNTCSATFLCIICIMCVICIKKKSIGLIISFNLAFVAILNYLLKVIFNRSRPINFMLIDETGYSFPSGHAMVSIVFYGFLIYLIYRYVRKENLKKVIIILLSLLIILIGFSRIYFGVHYPSDIIVGYVVGYVYLKIFIEFVKNRKIVE